MSPDPTRAEFAERVVAEMPAADDVLLERGGEYLGVATFESVRGVLDAEPEPLDVYPQRWLGRTFPAPWRLATMDLTPWGSGPP